MSSSTTATRSPIIEYGDTSTAKSVAELAGRVFLATIFLMSGVGKLGTFSATAAYMSSAGVSGDLLPVVIATEVLGAIAIIAGWKTRVVAFLLAGFTLLAALLFHNHFADRMQVTMFMKNVAIAGGFLLLMANGAGRFSLDHRART
jgi:putative oxidoreductase